MAIVGELEELARQGIVHAIDDALSNLTAWHPRKDSARVGDYQTARQVRRLLTEAQARMNATEAKA